MATPVADADLSRDAGGWRVHGAFVTNPTGLSYLAVGLVANQHYELFSERRSDGIYVVVIRKSAVPTAHRSSENGVVVIDAGAAKR